MRDLQPSASQVLRCPRCEYILTGLPERRCPECGEPFDPDALLEQAHNRSAEVISGRVEMIRRLQLREVILLQGAIALLLSLVLDGGVLLTVYLVSLAAYWAGVGLYIARQSTFSSRKLGLIRLAWLAVWVIGMVTAGVASRLSG